MFDSMKKKRSQSPLPLQKRKPLEFSEISPRKGSPINIPAHASEILKDEKIKEKLRGIFHKSREKKEKINSLINKVNHNQLKLKIDSDDDSQESEKEGYKEQINDPKQMKARNKLNILKKTNAMKEQSSLNENKDNIIPLLSYGRPGANEYINPNLLAYNALLHSDQQNKLVDKSGTNEKAIEFITYITNMKQNSMLGKDSEIIEEFKDNKKIVHIKTSDYFTFMRLEHEINEVIRKQKEFYELKKMYFEKKHNITNDEKDELLKIQESSQDRLKKTKDYQKGLTIAKRFIPAKKRRKDMTAIQIADQFITDTKKSTILNKTRKLSQKEI